MRLFVVWSADDRLEPSLRADDLALCFDPLALEQAHACGADVVEADSLLSWEARAAIDEQAAALADSLAHDPSLAAIKVGGQPLIEFAHYDLVVELSNLLRGFHLVDALARERPVEGLAAQPNTPSSLRLGVWAGMAAQDGLGGTPMPGEPWSAVSFSGSHDRLHALAAHGVMSVMRVVRRSNRIRILAVPAGKVAAALERCSRSDLLAAGVAISNFPGLSQGTAARLALTSGLPTVSTGALPVPREAAAGRSEDWSIPSLVEPAPLQRALRVVVESVLALSRRPTLRVARALRAWESLPSLRALLLPYTAVGPARLAARWAHGRGLKVAVVQHGIYGLRSGLGADSLADQVIGWGPGVAEQVAAWPRGGPRVCPAGVPDMLACPRLDPPDSIDRVLIATTNRPLGSAIGAYGLPEQFIEDLAPGLRTLSAAGVRVELRPHPAESRARYRALLAKLGLDVPFGEAGPLADAIRSCDLLISTVSSVAFEGAVAGRPVLLWDQRMPKPLRERCLLPPLDASGPGRFLDAREFEELARRALREPKAVIAEGRALAAALRAYAHPLDARRLATALRQLASDAAPGA
jgi:hypothetical protein